MRNLLRGGLTVVGVVMGLACQSASVTTDVAAPGAGSSSTLSSRAVAGPSLPEFRLFFKSPGVVPEAYVWFTPAGGALQQPFGAWANTSKMIAVGADWYVADLQAAGVPATQPVGVIFKAANAKLSGAADLTRSTGTGWLRMVNNAPQWSDSNPEATAVVPTVSLSPTDGVVTGVKTLTVNANGNGVPVFEVLASVQGVSTLVSGNSFSIDGSALAPGQSLSVLVKATNLNGSTTIGPFTYTKPAAGPGLTIHYKASWAVAAPTIWVWEGTGAGSSSSNDRPLSQLAGFSWPGPLMTKDEVQDWFSWTIPSNLLPLPAGLHFKFAGGAQVNLEGAVSASEWFNGSSWSLSNPDQVTTASASPASGSFSGSLAVTLLAANPANGTFRLNQGSSTPYLNGQVITLGAGMNPGEVATLAVTNGAVVNTFTYTKLADAGVTVHVKGYSSIYWWNVVPSGSQPVVAWPGAALVADPAAPGWKRFTFANATATNLIFNGPDGTVANLPSQTADLSRGTGSWWYANGVWLAANPEGPVTPVVAISPDGTRSNTPQLVTLTSSNTGDLIYVTTDGSVPTVASPRYQAPFTLSTSATVKAFAVNTLGVAGAVSTASFIIDPTIDLVAPSLAANPSPGSYPSAQTVTFTLRDNAGGASRAYFTTDGSTPTTSSPQYVAGAANGPNGLQGASLNVTANTVFTFLMIDAAGNSATATFSYLIGTSPRTDFRQETIYFVLPARFYDGDPSNNLHAWDDGHAGNTDADPAFRGDFKGLIQKLDYIKALGFSAIWITPVVQNASGYDYHGYHASNFKRVDQRYLSADTSYQTLIDAVHAKGMKLIQDIVLNHSSNFGEENLYPLFKKAWSKIYDASNHAVSINADSVQGLLNVAPTGKLPSNYDSLAPNAQFAARLNAMKDDALDPTHVYHHEKSLSWESYTVQTGQIAGDCVDLNTENPAVAEYLRQAYFQYIDQGVDAFRIDTVKHVNRLTFNREFIQQFKARGGSQFFIFGEIASRYRQVWNNGIPEVSAPFYTWKESKNYAWSATDRLVNEASTAAAWQDYSDLSSAQEFNSNNAYLNGNSYHVPDWSKRSGLDVIDFPMHWNFANAHDAFSVAVGNDFTYSDATFNVTYVESHDYAPDTAPETQRFALGQNVWAENLSLLFTFRGIPTVLYGDEVEFQKGKPLDVGPNDKLANTGRAYFGDQLTGSVTATGFGKYTNASGALATTLNHPLAQHLRQLNLLRRAIPALQAGQYSTADISSSSGLSFKRRFTDATTDSFALVTISGDATFNNIPNGTYVEAVTGTTVNVSSGRLTSAGAGNQGNLRIYVLNTALTAAPGKVVDTAGLTYLH